MRLILLTTLLLGSAALAQDNLADKIVNDPGAPNVNGAKAKLFDDPAVQGGKAVRVIVARKGKNDWDSNVESAINKPVKAGDRLVLAFQVKLESIDGGGATATLPYNALQMSGTPYSTVISGSVTAGSNWEFHKMEGKADRNYGPGELKATMQLGNAKQTVDFGPIAVFDLGQ
jgi:hypothetical protein